MAKRKNTSPKPAAPEPEPVTGMVADPAQERDARITGALDAIVGRAAEGWALDPESPDNPVIVEIFDGDRLLGSAAALMFRADLLAAGIGTGHHHFKFLLPETVFDGQLHLISARPAGSTKQLRKSPVQVNQTLALATGAAPVEGLPEEKAVGAFEVLSEDGWIKGWAWYPTTPDKHVEIEVLVDGTVVGETMAALPRPDLITAGIGSGDHSFEFALPPEILRRPSSSLVSIRDKRGGRVFLEPRVFLRRPVVHAMDELADLEADSRLLQSTLAMAERDAGAEKRAAAELFRTVGDFFQQLAAATAAGRPPGSLLSLRGAIADVTGRLAPITLAFQPEPLLSVCVEAGAPADATHGLLRSLAESLPALPTEVILFDTGASDETPLLPLVVRNLRYLRLTEGVVAPDVLNKVVEFSRGSIVMVLSGDVAPENGALAAVVSTFDGNRGVDMVGARIVAGNGLIVSAGVTLKAGRGIPLGPGEDPHAQEFSMPRSIDAVASQAFAFRKSAWLRIGGVDPSGVNRDQALAALCARMNSDGGRILYDPGFAVAVRPSTGGGKGSA